MGRGGREFLRRERAGRNEFGGREEFCFFCEGKAEEEKEERRASSFFFFFILSNSN